MSTDYIPDWSERDITPERAAAEEVCNHINCKDELRAEAHPTGEDISITIKSGGFLDPSEIGFMAARGFVITNLYTHDPEEGDTTIICHHESNLDEVGWDDE